MKMSSCLHLLLGAALFVRAATVSPEIKESWFLFYGNVGEGRPLSEGKNLGDMGLIQCSRLCSEDSSCRGLQFDGSKGRVGPCYSFTDLTHNGRMVAMAGHKYFEKRPEVCAHVLVTDALLVFPNYNHMILFTGDTVYMYYMLGQNLLYLMHDVATTYFPGLPTPVQAAFLGVTPEIVYIYAGGQMYCYQNLLPGFPTSFTTCTPTDVLTPFLTTHPISISAVVSQDASPSLIRHLLYIIDGDTIYKLQWNASTMKYDFQYSFPRTDAGENFSGMPGNANAISQQFNDNILIMEKHKIYRYNLGTKQVDMISQLCDKSV